MLTLNDGRSELWQWDTGRTLAVDADCSQVHFSNKVFGRSIDVDVIDGVAIIPDILLQTDKDLNVWAFVGTAENGYTKISKTFKVNRRNKPADYVFTPPEQTTLGEILERLDDIESAQDPDAIKNAVDDYLDNNPIQIEETDPTVPAWAKQPTKPQYTAVEVGAMAADAPVVKTVNGTAPDASGNVTVEAGGGGSIELDATLTQSGKAADAKAVGDALAELENKIPESGGGDSLWRELLRFTLTEPARPNFTALEDGTLLTDIKCDSYKVVVRSKKGNERKSGWLYAQFGSVEVIIGQYLEWVSNEHDRLIDMEMRRVSGNTWEFDTDVKRLEDTHVNIYDAYHGHNVIDAITEELHQIELDCDFEAGTEVVFYGK